MALIRGNGGGLAEVVGGSVNDDTWHHVALTRNAGNTLELYLDGVSQGTDSVAGANDAITTDLKAVGAEEYWIQVSYATADQRYLDALQRGNLEENEMSEGDDWYSDEHETLADKMFADSQAAAQEEQGFQVGEFVYVVNGSLKGASGKILEPVTTSTGEEGFAIELYSDAKKKVFGKRGDEVIALPQDLESGGTTDDMELYDIDEAKNEDGKEQGVDGKACWKGKKYAGSEDTDGDGKADKDKCVPMEEVALSERGSPLESGLQTAVQDFIIEQMQKMGLNAGDPTDRDRIKNQVYTFVTF